MAAGLVSSFVLSVSLAVAPVDTAYADPSGEAVKHIGKAFYKQFKVDNYLSRLERKYLSDDIRKYGSMIGITARMIAEKKITYTWRF